MSLGTPQSGNPLESGRKRRHKKVIETNVYQLALPILGALKIVTGVLGEQVNELQRRLKEQQEDAKLPWYRR